MGGNFAADKGPFIFYERGGAGGIWGGGAHSKKIGLKEGLNGVVAFTVIG